MLKEGELGLIFSVQSHVAFGHVGNRAAVFPLERLGHEVVQINTVNFSNHSGYGKFQGDYVLAQNILNIFDGVLDVAGIFRFNALLTGYVGTQDIAEVIKKNIFRRLKTANQDLVYCLDPVIGEVGRGIFVKPEVAEYFKRDMMSVADIITPNLFEAQYLSDIDITSYSDAKRAADILHDKGPKVIVITSLKVKDTEAGCIDTMLSYQGQKMLISTPEIPFPISPNGCGDLFSALFLGHYLKFGAEIALAKAVSVIYEILRTTQHANSRELQIILAQDKIVNPEISIAIKGI